MFDLQGECTESAILSLAYLSSHEILLHNLRFNLESVKRKVNTFLFHLANSRFNISPKNREIEPKTTDFSNEVNFIGLRS